MSQERKAYRTFAVERELSTDRRSAWDLLHEVLVGESGGYRTEGDPPPHGLGAVRELEVGGLALTETVISHEPPWRRVYGLAGTPLALCEGTTAFVDRGPSCLVSWSLVLDPPADGSGEGFIGSLEDLVARLVGSLAAVVESSG